MSMFQENFANFSSPESEDEPNSDSETSQQELDLWCYIDPMGKMQGPFSSAKMLRWKPFFHRTMRVWRYGSDKQITYEDFLRQYKVNPLWTYFDEEDEPLLEIKKAANGTDESDSDNESVQRNYDFKDQPGKEINNAIAVNNSNRNAATNSVDEESSEAEDENEDESMSMSEYTEYTLGSDETSQKTDSEVSYKSSRENGSVFQDNVANSQQKQLNAAGHDINVDVGVNDNVPDVYRMFADVQKKTPVHPLEYTPYMNDRKGQPAEKENVRPIEEIPSHSGHTMNGGVAQGGRGGGGQMWNGEQIQMNPAQFGTHRPYYMSVPPPLPLYLSTPPPVMWPMRALEPPRGIPHKLPPSSYAPVNLPPSPYFAGQDPRAYNSYGHSSNRLPPPPNVYNAPQQPGNVQQMHQMYRQQYPNSDRGNNIDQFCEGLIEKYMTFTNQRMQQLYMENQKLKMSQQKLQAEKKQPALEYTGTVSFAKVASLKGDNSKNGKEQEEGSGKKVEVKSFWDTVPQPQPPKAPQKKVNKYPMGFVGEGAKKKMEKADDDGVAEFTEWCLTTLNYISENKLNVEGLRVVLNEMETIACVERYIKMWLDDFNPKMWHLFNEKLKKFRKQGNADELNSPARANPYDVEKQKQKEKIQKKAELFVTNKDLNTANINRHLTKIQQFGKK